MPPTASRCPKRSSPDLLPRAEAAAGRLLKTSEQIVVKLLSKAISHKSDIGGVVLDIASRRLPPGTAAARSQARVRKHAPQADIEGYAVQPMVVRKQAQELILGMSRDPIFGPVILFGAGGVAVEVMDDTAIALPPLDDVLAGDLIDANADRPPARRIPRSQAGRSAGDHRPRSTACRR